MIEFRGVLFYETNFRTYRCVWGRVLALGSLCWDLLAIVFWLESMISFVVRLITGLLQLILDLLYACLSFWLWVLGSLNRVFFLVPMISYVIKLITALLQMILDLLYTCLSLLLRILRTLNRVFLLLLLWAVSFRWFTSFGADFAGHFDDLLVVAGIISAFSFLTGFKFHLFDLLLLLWAVIAVFCCFHSLPSVWLILSRWRPSLWSILTRSGWLLRRIF